MHNCQGLCGVTCLYLFVSCDRYSGLFHHS
uniref:Glutamateglyoxylate aminotransferase 2 n=1 Tax=Rhizophora mucronata TaxID=61149 RepID=A0A2P2MNB6_RHIMU